ncbi:hypothetical protein [Mesorhizobium sp. CCNWLW179-1]
MTRVTGSAMHAIFNWDRRVGPIASLLGSDIAMLHIGIRLPVKDVSEDPVSATLPHHYGRMTSANDLSNCFEP